MDTKETLRQVWEAFNMLSKAQDIIANNPLGYRSLDAVETIEDAKQHLNTIFQQTDEPLRVATEEPCQLTATH
jgi:hypothetical protein|tara:strand:+ start:478 stop:696 length:219 start_codon:yes stop_codon:yes gene_type:complete